MTNLSHLKTVLELARKATPGEWLWQDPVAQKGDLLTYGLRSERGVVLDEWSEYANDAGVRVHEYDAAFIAAMSPDLIIPALEEAIAAMERDAKEKTALTEMSRLAQETGEYD